jgi:uncharacterized membrane protein YkoI
MQRTFPALIAVVAGCLFAGCGAVAQPTGAPPTHTPNSLGADWRLQQDEVRQCARQHRCVPLAKVIEQIDARSPGRQLDAGLEYRGDKPIYRVRWMTRNGRRVDYLIDAATGAILSGG